MTFQILLSPAGDDKTARAINAIRALPPLSPVRVVVPGQLQIGAFRRRLAEAGGALGVRVQTFYGLYADVLAVADGAARPFQERLGQGMARVLPAVRYRLIQHIVEAVCDAGHLPYYAPLRHSPGFIHLLGGLFEELKRARVFPEELESALSPSKARGEEGRTGSRLSELGHLYSAYQGWLIKTGWVDAEGQGWLAAIALARDPLLFSSQSLLVLDGFDEFNPTQLHLLRLLADRTTDTLITLTGGAATGPDRLAHRRFLRARRALERAFGVDQTRVSTAPAPPLPRPLAHLEATLFEPSSSKVPVDDAVAFLEAQNRAAEAREALRWVKARVVRDEVPFSNVAVIIRDVAPYRPFLEEISAEFGMPLQFASGVGLRTNPVIAALGNLLALPLEPVGWSPRVLLDVLVSPYFDWSGCGLVPGDAGLLEGIACAGQVISGLPQWAEAFRQLVGRDAGERRPTAPGAIDEEGLAPRRLPVGEGARRLEATFDDIAARITPPPQATLRERVVWLERLIGEDPSLAPGEATTGTDASRLADDTSLNIVERAREGLATAERDIAALRALKDILRGLVQADSLLNATRGAVLSCDEFIAQLDQAIEDATYSIPVDGDAILIASVLEARGLAFDSVVILGLAEGDFPRVEREDALLRESDRNLLAERGFAIEPRLQGDEATFFYQAVTLARSRLLLCRPYLADDGQPWEASPYWSAVSELFEDAAVGHVRPTDLVSDVASEQEFAEVAPSDDTRDAVAVIQARSQTRPSAWNGSLSMLGVQLTRRFGPDQLWSSSRLETYAKCPFYFWVAHALEVDARELPQVGFDALILGSIFHLVLERLYNRVVGADADRLRSELALVAREVYDAAPSEYGFRPTPLWEQKQEDLTEALSRTLEALIEIAGEYEPLVQELPFGLRGRSPLVVSGVEGQTSSLQLRGYIDRVDRGPDGRLRIIDYKAGSTPIRARDLVAGHRLQLPLYALAAQQALGADVAGGFYWHISSARPSSLKLERFRGGVAGAIETAVGHALAIGAAVCAGQFAPSPPDDGCPSFCPAVTFCERYGRGRHAGGRW